MSGIEIDVNLRAEAAKRDLQAINKSMKTLVDSSKNTGKAFSQFKPKPFDTKALSMAKPTLSVQKFGRESKKSMDTATKSVKETENAFSSVKRTVVGLVAALAAFQGVSSFNKAGDNLTNLQNRLKLVTKSTDELIIRQNQLFKISRESRSSFNDTVNMYATFSKALEKSGMASSRIAGVVGTLQKGVALSGASIDSASAALTQLGQGISAGALRGQELNSVLEQLPYIGQGIAESMKMTTGQLRELAATGAVGAEAVVRALETLAKRASKDFANTAVTASAAMLQLRQSVGLFFGELNMLVGSSAGFGKRIMAFADYFAEASQLIGARAYTVRQSIQNYIESFNMQSAAALTVKAALKLDITPLEIYEKYKFYRTVKDQLESFKTFFGMNKKLEVDAGGVEVKGLDPRFSKPEVQLSGFQRLLADTKRLGKAIADSLVVTYSNLTRLAPIILTPFVEISTTLKQSLKSMLVDVDYWMVKGLLPVSRGIEEFAQQMTAWGIGDNAVERAWVNLFKSKTFTDTITNLEKLNAARRQIRFDDRGFVGKELIRNLQKASFAVEDVLIQLGIMDNTLLRIRDTRLDRIIMYFAQIGRVARRLYSDLLAPVLEPMALKLLIGMEAIAITLLDVFTDKFNGRSGRQVALDFVNGYMKGLALLAGNWRKIGKTDWSESFLGKITGSQLVKALGGALVSLGEFILAFFKQLGVSIASAVAESAVGKMFAGFRDAATTAMQSVITSVSAMRDAVTARFTDFDLMSKLGIDSSGLEAAADYLVSMYTRIFDKTSELSQKVVQKVAAFGTSIKRIFFEVYDAVVGHSYWPDLIDGVVDYTDRLVHSENKVSAFGNRITAIFKGIFNKMKEFGLAAGGSIADFTIRISNVDMSSFLTVVKSNLEASVIAGLMFAFGGTKAKVAAVSYFATVINGAVDSAFDAFGPAIGESLGNGLRTFGKHMFQTMVDSLDMFIGLVPKFVDGFLGGLSPLSGWASKMLSWLPLVTNNLATSIIAAGALFAIFNKKGTGTIMSLLMGKAGKKGAPRQDGIVDYAKLMVPSLASSGEGIFANLFASKKLAVLGAAAMSTALLESVSILEAAEIGLPLLAFAVFGKDGGAGLARQGVSIVTTLIGAVYTTGRSFVTKLVGADSWISKMLYIPDALMSSASGAAKGAVASAFGDVYDTALQLTKNMRRNAAAFGRGEMSFADMFLMTQTSLGAGIVGRQRMKLNNVFDGLFSAISAVQLGSSGSHSVGSVLTSMIDTIKLGIPKFRAALGSFKAVFVRTFSSGWTAALGTIGLIKDGFKGLFATVGSKWFIFAALAAGLTGTAFAASGTSKVLGDMSSNLGDVLGVLVKLTAALVAYGVAYRAAMSFKAGTDVFSAMKAGTYVAPVYDDALAAFTKKRAIAGEASLAADLAAMRTRLDRNAKKTMKARIFATESERFIAQSRMQKATELRLIRYKASRAKANAALELAELATFDRDFKKQQDRLAAVGGSKTRFGAGVASLSLAIRDAFEGTRGAVGRYFSFVSSQLNGTGRGAISFGARTRKVLENTFKINPAAITLMSEGAASLASSLRQISQGNIIASVTALGVGLRDIAKGAKAAATADAASALINLFTFRKAGRALRDIGRGAVTAGGSILSKIGKPLWALTKPLAKLFGKGAIVAGVGTLALGLFGPGNTFIDNLEWAYDKVRSIFGLQAKTKGGRRGEIENLVGGNQDIGDREINLAMQLRGVDYESLTETQYKVLLGAASATSEALSNLREQTILDGSVSAATTKEMDRVLKSFTNAITRMPQKEGQSFKGLYDSEIASLTAIDDTIWEMMRNFIGYKPILSAADRDVSFLQEVFTTYESGFDAIGRHLSSWPAIILGTIGTVVGGFVGSIVPGLGTMLGGIVGGALGTGLGAALSVIGSYIADLVVWTFKSLLGLLKMSLKGWMDLGNAANTLIKDLTGVDIKGAFISLGESVQDGVIAFGDQVSIWSAQFMDSLRTKPNDLDKASAEKFKASTGNLTKYSTALSGVQQEELAKSLAEAVDAQRRYNTLLKEGQRISNSTDDADYANKLAAAAKEADLLFQQYDSLTGAMRPLAESLFKTQKLLVSQKTVFDEAKTLLETDFTEGKFIGDVFDFRQIKADVKKVKGLLKELETTSDYAGRRDINLKIAAAKASSAEQLTTMTAAAKFSTDVDLKVNLLGDAFTTDTLRNLFVNSPEIYASLEGASKEYARLTAQFAQMKTTSSRKELQELVARLSELRREAIDLLPAIRNFDQINASIQALGGEAVSARVFGSMGEAARSAFAAGSTSVVKMKEELQTLFDGNASPEAQAAKLKQIEQMTAATLANIKSAQVDLAEGAMADTALNTVQKAYAVAQALGVEVPESIQGNAKAQGEWARILIDMVGKQMLLNGLIVAGAEGSGDQIAALDSALAGLNKRLSTVTTAATVFTLDSLISKLSETGVAVTDISFSRLGTSAQSALAGIGSQLEAISKKFSESSASGMVGSGLAKLVAQREALLQQAREMLLDTLHSTGAGITEGLSRLGLSEMSAIAKLATSQVAVLLDLDKSLERTRLSMADTTDLEAYMAAVRKTTALEKQRDRLIKEASRSFSTDVESINSVFNTGLDASAFSSFNRGLFDNLASYSRELELSLEEAISSGVSAGGESVAQVFARIKDANKTGAYLSFFATMAADMENALSAGAKSAFEIMSQSIGEIAIDFDTFLSIPAELRKSYTAQSAALASYEKALDLPGLTQSMVDVLNQVNKAPADIMAEFSDTYLSETGTLFSDAIKGTSEKLVDSLDGLRDPVQLIADHFSKVAGKQTPVAAAVKTVATNAVPVAGYRNLGSIKATQNEQMQQAAIAGAPTPALKLSATLQGASGGLVDASARLMATGRQQERLFSIGTALNAKTAELNAAVRNGLPTRELAISVEAYKTSLADLSQAIINESARASEAGKSFASSISDSVTTGFADALKGKHDEGKGVMETFVDNFLDTFTNSVIDSFAAGLLDPLTGENGIITTSMKSLGAGLFGSANGITEGLGSSVMGLFGKKDAFVGPMQPDPAASLSESITAQEGMFAGLGNIFSEKLAGLGDIFMGGLGLLQQGLGGLLGGLFGGGGGGSGIFGTIVKGVAGYFSGGATAAVAAASGGYISGAGTSTSDSISAWLSNGEYVVNAAATAKNLPLLKAINGGNYKAPRFATGGLVGVTPNDTYPTSATPPTPTPGQSSEQVFNINVTGDISKMTRMEIQRMIPQIAAGISKHNYEHRSR